MTADTTTESVPASDPPQPDRAPAARAHAWWQFHAPLALVLPPLLYAVLSPDSFGLPPNNLDPYFYAGYAFNFDDIMREIGGGRYFVSRWTVYLPSRLFTVWFGFEAGRLLLRWIVASAMLLAVWHLGRRWHWSRSTAVVTGVVVLSSPIFVRAFTTDYVEWLVVGLGFVVVCLAVEPGWSHLRSATIGVLSAAVVIANPLALPVVAVPLAAGLWLGRGSDRARAITHLAEVAAGGVVVVVGGWWLFRTRYGIANVYQPTIDFMGSNPGHDDPLRSPRFEWMIAFTWIYVPALIGLTVAVVPRLRRRVLEDTVVRAVVVTLCVQYLWHWADQFLRGGNSLEISYYWSFIYPSLGVAMVTLLGLVKWNPARAAAFIAGWWTIIVVTRLTDLRLPGGAWALLTLLVIGGAIAVVDRRLRRVAAPAMALVGLTMQVAAPDYNPSAYHAYNVDPLYDRVLYTDAGDRELAAALWFADELDALPDDAGLYFIGTGAASSIVGIYGAHVTGRLLFPNDDGLATIDIGTVPRLALYGPPDDVAPLLDRITLDGDRGTVILDASGGDGLGYRLAVVDLPIPTYEPVTWSARSLPGAVGTVEGTARAAEAKGGAGVLVGGPGVYLDAGTYRISVAYSATADVDQIVGSFEVTLDGETVASTPLPGTRGRTVPVGIDVDAPEGLGYEFKVVVTGESDVVVESVASEPIGT